VPFTFTILPSFQNLDDDFKYFKTLKKVDVDIDDAIISPCVMCVDDKESPYDSTQAAVGKTSRFGYLGVLVAVMVMIIECGLFQMMQLRGVEGEGDVKLVG
jgi:hypothetical protein